MTIEGTITGRISGIGPHLNMCDVPKVRWMTTAPPTVNGTQIMAEFGVDETYVLTFDAEWGGGRGGWFTQRNVAKNLKGMRRWRIWP